MNNRSIARTQSHDRVGSGTSFRDRFRDLFGAHLNLSPLRGRSVGKVRCIFHPDQTPSLSIDLARGIFHCFGCEVGGGWRKFADLVGESCPGLLQSGNSKSDSEEAWRRVVRQAQAEGARALEWRPYAALGDFIRRSAQAASRARELATNVLGPDDPRTWPLLERAARIQRDGLAAEAALDEIVADGRIA